jgi:hypothetical protein
MKKTISILENELEARAREIRELHVLLQQAQAVALPAGRQQEFRRPWWRRILKK